MKQVFILMFGSTAILMFVFYMGVFYARNERNDKIIELQKKYLHELNELDQCVKMNLELRRKK